ncbi:hypothetical protein BC833DRAFT_522114 [Globomyces pollinis-pini]|nr:hypothetical protein BC833DRAFT_522114 [Globomyces pollinis-pini]
MIIPIVEVVDTEEEVVEVGKHKRHDSRDSKHGLQSRDKEKMLRSKEKKERLKSEMEAKKGTSKPKIRKVYLQEGISVANLSSLLGVRYEQLLRKLKQSGFEEYPSDFVLNSEIASLIVLEYNMSPVVIQEDTTDLERRPPPTDWSQYPPRPPVITIMGHVDHGKTTLLDSLRKTSVAAGEAGGITQHIGAFSVLLPSGKRITFLDTPGHAAFSSMRERGAEVTDIVVLVVAADDGIMPQTVEAINHSLNANVPIIVAINKCDKPNIKPSKIKEMLVQHNIVVEEFGGDIPAVHVSGKTGMGLSELEETILAIAEVNEYKGDPDGPVEGVVIESRMEKGFGNVASVIVQRGTLKPGTLITAGQTWCRVKNLVDEHRNEILEVGPSGTVEVSGWKGLPSAGDTVIEAESEALAKKVIFNRKRRHSIAESIKSIDSINEKRAAAKLENEALAKIKNRPRGSKKLQTEEETEDTIVKKEIPSYRVVLKGRLVCFNLLADVDGSLEAIEGAIASLPQYEVKCDIISSGVGSPTESDVQFAVAGKADIIAFNVPIINLIRGKAKENQIELYSHNIIYQLIDKIKECMSDLLEPDLVESVIGEANVAQIFEINMKKKKEKIAGCRVMTGKILRSEHIRLIRNEQVIYTGKIKTFKHHKKDILEAQKGLECGIALEEFDDIQAGDKLQGFSITKVKRTL